MKNYKPLSANEEKIATDIVHSAFKIHTELGPGLLEKIYEIVFAYELEKLGYSIERQKYIPIHYEAITFNEGLRLDVLVNDLVICELKAIENVNPVWEAQILSHLKLTGKRLGFLINFCVPKIKDGIRRFVL